MANEYYLGHNKILSAAHYFDFFNTADEYYPGHYIIVLLAAHAFQRL